MHNITPEDLYKEAVRSKYEEEKSGGYSNYLSNPSQASLRDLCWKLFKLNPTENDLKIYFHFFKFEFDPLNENTSIEYTNKFKKLGSFLRGDKKPAKIDTVDFAAILVDYKHRPYNNFNKKIIDKSTLEEKPIDIPNDPEFVIGAESENDVEIISPTEKEINKPVNPIQKSKFYIRIFKRSRRTIAGTLIIFVLVATVICFIFFKKGCMQWSENHYEIVYCDKPIKGNLNEVIQIDYNLLSLRKIPICDTSRCFRPDGEAIVWYTKSNKKVDFFNSYGNGKHPENKSTMRPISDHIFKKYKKKDCASK